MYNVSDSTSSGTAAAASSVAPSAGASVISTSPLCCMGATSAMALITRKAKNGFNRIKASDPCTVTRMVLSLDTDAIAVVASHCDWQTVAALCRTAYRVKEVVQPQLYRRVVVRSFKEASLFLTAIAKGQPALGKLVAAYSETSDVRMPHLVTSDFAKIVMKSLMRMPNLEVLRLANSIQSLHDFNSGFIPSLRQLRHLKDVELYDYPTVADGFANPNTSLSALQLNGADMRSNSSHLPAPHFVKRLVYQSYDNLQILRLTMSSLVNVVKDCEGIMWERVHSLGLDDCIIPEEFTTVFPNVVKLELWAASPREKHIPDHGWPKLERVEYIAQALSTNNPVSTHLYTRPRTVSTLVVRSNGSEPLHGIFSAFECVDKEKLEHVRLGYVVRLDATTFWSACRHVYSVEIELRMTDVKNESFLKGLALCTALQDLILVFREQEAMADFENRCLQPFYYESAEQDTRRIPARTAFGTAFARALGGKGFGSRRVIPRPDLLRRIVLSLRLGWCAEYLEIMRRTWMFDDLTVSWTLMDYP